MKRLCKWLFRFVLLMIIIGGCSFVMAKSTGNINIVIVGIDTREGVEGARSDTIMLAHIDAQHEQAKLVSIPRDAYVYIPKVDYEDKINHAYAFGGLDGLLTTLNTLFDQKFTYYVEVDFLKMIKLIDTIDGIMLTPSSSFCEMNEKDIANAFCFEEDVEVAMNGEQALAYARHRKSDNDLYRVTRQQEVVKAMITKVKKSNPVTVYRFYRKFQKISNTNLEFQEFIKYSDLLYNGFSLTQDVAQGYSDTVYSPIYNQYISYFFLDDEWLTQMQNELRK
ncbi:MAG: LCP family protein [Breznakia sp.]